MQMLNNENFQDVISQEGLVLVDFFNEGCVPCMALLPEVVELSEKYTQVKFCKFDTLAVKKRFLIGLRVLGLPTIHLYKDGEKVAELVKDDATAAAIEEMIKNNL